jgi:hypothetical protein
MKKPLHQTFKTHTAPYYGGEKMARTLAEAFGPGAKLHVSLSTRLRRRAPEIVIVASVVAVVITLLVGP